MGANNGPAETPIYFLIGSGRLGEFFTLDFEAFARLYPDEVSGGEMQRITLMILLSRPGNLILLDEPTVNLDRNLRKNFVEFLNKEILCDKSKTFLMVSHDVDFIRRLTLTQAFMLKDGDIEKQTALPELEGVATDGVEGVAVDDVATTAAVLLDGIIIVDGAALAAKTAPNVKPKPNVSVAIKRFIYPSHYFISLMNI